MFAVCEDPRSVLCSTVGIGEIWFECMLLNVLPTVMQVVPSPGSSDKRIIIRFNATCVLG